eukprot:g19704.t1
MHESCIALVPQKAEERFLSEGDKPFFQYDTNDCKYADITILCQDCNKDFTFPGHEQEYYERMGFTHHPVRCRACQAAKKASMTGMCYAFQAGTCQRGDGCRFSHKGGQGAGPLVCYQWQSGNCNFGDQCKFLHQADNSGGGGGGYNQGGGGGGYGGYNPYGQGGGGVVVAVVTVVVAVVTVVVVVALVTVVVAAMVEVVVVVEVVMAAAAAVAAEDQTLAALAKSCVATTKPKAPVPTGTTAAFRTTARSILPLQEQLPPILPLQEYLPFLTQLLAIQTA